MQNLLARVDATLQERGLVRSGEVLVVAVSGGLDSMVLLHLLHRLAAKHGWKLVVAHFNHHLRGRASDGDERFVRKAAEALGWPVRVGHGDVKAFAKRRGLSLEMAARELRHRYLAEVAQRGGGRTIATAHHADDQVELFFLRAFRGAGTDGLAGMKWRSVSPADKKIHIVRPFLDLNRITLEQFAREEKIRHREDASNASSDLLRNRVRHELLPLLRRRFQPALERAILRVMDLCGADAELANDAARLWLKSDKQRRRLSECPVGLQRRVIRHQLLAKGLNLDFDLVEELRLGLGKAVTIAPGCRMRCDAAGQLSRVSSPPASFMTRRKRVRLARPSGTVRFAGADFAWQRTERVKAGIRRPTPGQEIFDAARIGPHVALRHWQAGDRFQPIGMKAAVKLQDWFTNLKVPAEQRRELVVATTGDGEVFWVEGQRIGERFKVSPSTRQQLVWRWNRNKTS